MRKQLQKTLITILFSVISTMVIGQAPGTITIMGPYEVTSTGETLVTEVCVGNEYTFRAVVSNPTYPDCEDCYYLSPYSCLNYFNWGYETENDVNGVTESEWSEDQKGSDEFIKKITEDMTQIRCRAYMKLSGAFNNDYTSYGTLNLIHTTAGTLDSTTFKDLNLTDNTITLNVDEREFEEGDTLYIRNNDDGDPIMPNIQIQFHASCNSMDVLYRAQIEYSRLGECFDAGTRNNNPQLTFFPDSIANADSTDMDMNHWKLTKAANLVNIDFQNKFRGGTVKIYERWTDENSLVVNDSIEFSILGLNPTIEEISDYIDDENNVNGECESLWFMEKIFAHETRRCHFFHDTYPNDVRNCENFGNGNREYHPLFGPPDGHGIGQLDNGIDGGINGSLDGLSPCNFLAGVRAGKNLFAQEEALWNWQNAIATACNFMDASKITAVKRRLRQYSLPRAQVFYINNNNTLAPNPADITYNGETFTHARSPLITYTNVTHRTLYERHFPNAAGNGSYSFLDASIIKSYNGASGCTGNGSGGGEFYRFPNPTDPPSPAPPILGTEWEACTINSLNFNYVQLVCNENP